MLSALPLVSAANLCCCLWVVAGGVVAAYLLQQNQTAPIDAGDGALVGLFAGVIAAFVYLAISIPINILMGPIEQRVIQRVFERLGNVPPTFSDYATSPFGRAVVVFIDFVFRLVAGSVFSTIGGLLGAVIFRKKIVPGTVDVPPSA